MRWIGQHRTDGLHLLIAGVFGFMLALAGTGSPTAYAQEKLPAAPSNLQASLKGTSGVVLSWNDNSTNESGFRIWRNIGGIRYALRGETKADVTAWEESGLSVCTTYYYQVTAFNVTGNSDPSNVAQVTTPCPDIYLLETEHDFGAIQVGNGVGWRLEVRNVGDAELVATQIISSDPQFTVTPTEFSLIPGARVLLTVEFAPTAVGDQKAILTISSNDSDEPTVEVQLTGVGTEPQVPDISLSATEYNFEDVLVGGSFSWILVITNTGNVELEVGAITTTDPQFSLSTAGYFSLMAGGSVDVRVTFTPESPGQHTATLSVESTDPDEATVTVTLIGAGTEPQVPDIFLSATGHNFGDVIVGESSTWELVVSNVGSATLAVSEIASTNSQFAVSGDAFSVPAEAVRSVTIAFAPTSAGEQTATLSIVSNDPDQAVVQLALTGTGLPGEVTFADANLEAAVREALGQAEGPLTPSSLAGLAELYAPELGITELGGIEYCANLEVLELYTNDITEIEPLGGLTRLTHLYLNGNRITDISTLNGLQELVELTLSDNQISQLTPLSGLIGLRELDLRGNQISDIGPLSAVAGLRWLMLDWNQISDLSALTDLANLAELGLCGNQVADLAALRELTALTHLYLGENDITDIGPLSQLTNLVELGLWANAIGDLSPLSGLTRLRSLDLNDSQVNSIGPLSGLTALQALHLEYNRVSDLSPLTDLTSLRALQLDANQITDVSPLEGLTSIGEPWGYPKEREGIEVHLGLSENDISDIGPIVANVGIGEGDGIDLRGNPLGTAALTSSIPALRERGVNVLADAVAIPHPELSVSTDTLGFGSVTLDHSAALTLTISNAGDAVGVCNVSSDNNQFTVFPASFSVPPEDSQPVEVTFTPTATGHQAATLIIACSDPSQPILLVAALGVGTQVGIELSADEHDFGEVWVGRSATSNLQVSNTGTLRLAVVAYVSADAEFSASPDSFFVSGGEDQDVTVTFSPTFAGEQVATLAVTAGLADQPASELGLLLWVTLTGIGVLPPQIELSAAEHDFGDVPVDSSSAWTLGVSNTGQATLEVSGITSSDPQFVPSVRQVIPIDVGGGSLIDTTSALSPLSFKVAGGATREVTVMFKPTSAGEQNATLVIRSNDPDQPSVEVPVSGNGVAARIGLSAQEHAFGPVSVDSSATWILTVSNTGHLALEVSGIALTDAQFTASPIAFTVPPGSIHELAVTFTPSSVGGQNATLTIPSNDPQQPASEVLLTGNGALPDIVLSATEHDFGDVTVDSSSTWTLGISNLGQIDLKVTSISSSDTQFTPSPRSLSVEPQQSGDVSVTFAPTFSGEHSAELTLISNDPDGATLVVSLSGNGVVPPPAVSYVPGAELPAHGQQARVAIQVEGNRPVQATLYYRAGGSSQYQTRSMEPTGDGVYEAQVPSSEVGLRGLEAYVRVEDELGGISFFPADGNPMSVRVRYTSQESPALALDTWRMVSVPGRCDDGGVAAVLKDLGAYDKTKWRLFSHDRDGYHEYSEGSTGGFAPGRSFWLCTRQAANARISSGITVRTDTTFNIQLQPGWNDIGNPFFFSVRWQDILEESNAAEVVKGPYLYGGDTGWEIQGALQPWKGYAVHNPQAGAFVLAVPARAIAAAKPASADLEKGAVRLVVSVEAVEDRGTFLGWREDASQGLDRWDYPEPPDPPGDFVSVYFPHSQWPGGLYTTDFRPPSRQGTWDFCVRTNLKNRPATLTVHMPSSALDVHLLDVDQGTATPLAGPYCFSTGAGKRSFSLVLGSSEEIAQLLDRERVPKRSAVIKSYPNPFNASTVIAYWLPDKKAHISIYNLLGQEVSCLLDGSDGPGYDTLRWDGTDAAGHALPSGVYVCVLRSGGLRAIERLVILR